MNEKWESGEWELQQVELLQTIENCLELLNSVEWIPLPYEAHYIGCPFCEMSKQNGHAKDCRFVKANQ